MCESESSGWYGVRCIVDEPSFWISTAHFGSTMARELGTGDSQRLHDFVLVGKIETPPQWYLEETMANIMAALISYLGRGKKGRAKLLPKLAQTHNTTSDEEFSETPLRWYCHIPQEEGRANQRIA